ncbi:hypothetical protein Peur_033717 [Populus x canadensis]
MPLFTNYSRETLTTLTENACMSKTKVRTASSEAHQQKEQGTSNNSKDDSVSEALSNALSQTTPSRISSRKG